VEAHCGDSEGRENLDQVPGGSSSQHQPTGEGEEKEENTVQV